MGTLLRFLILEFTDWPQQLMKKAYAFQILGSRPVLINPARTTAEKKAYYTLKNSSSASVLINAQLKKYKQCFPLPKPVSLTQRRKFTFSTHALYLSQSCTKIGE